MFYSNDFTSGTQDMSCEEVGAYVRLLVYQHQHGAVPVDPERMMRITGIFSEERFIKVWGVVGKKFKHFDNHLVNERLSKEVNERLTGRPKKIAAATLAGLISSSNLKPKQVKKIKENFKIEEFLYIESELLTDISALKSNINEWFRRIVNQMVNNKEDVNENKSINKNNTKTTDSTPPEEEKASKTSIDFEGVIGLFHRCCPGFPKVTKLTESRKGKIRVRLGEMGGMEVAEAVFGKMAASKFLKGYNDRGWKATFDWVMENDKNWVKVIEGQYDDRKANDAGGSGAVQGGFGEKVYTGTL